MDTLLKDMPLESIPVRIGGKFELYNEAYEFDVSEGGPLHCIAHGAAAPSTSFSVTLRSLDNTTVDGAMISDTATAAVVIEEKPPTCSFECKVKESSHDVILSEGTASAVNIIDDDTGEENDRNGENERIIC